MIGKTQGGCRYLGFVESIVHVQFDERPIVESSAPHCVIVNPKPQGLDKMQCAARGRAEPGNIAGVRRNFRLYQDDVKWPDWTRGPQPLVGGQ